MNKTIEKAGGYRVNRNSGLTGASSQDTDCMAMAASSGGRRLTKAERARMEEREQEEKAQYLARLHQDRVNRLMAGMAMLEGPVISGLLNFSQIINEQMNAQGFWESDNFGEKIALMHSELSEALEADRKDLMSDHIEGFTGVAEELADVIVRVLDLAAQNNIPVGEALFAKMRFNLSRPYKHGKAY